MSDPTPAYRDPPSGDAEAAALRLALARTLTRAPTLPLPLPAYGDLRLLTVEADRRAVDLLVGFEDPVARLRFTAPRDAAPTVAVHPLVPTPERVTTALHTMAERLQRATPAARWADALALARRLAELPSAVPLGYFRQLVAGLDAERSTALVRVGFRCNQDCGMCWQGRHWGTWGSEQIIRWIEDLRPFTPRLSISGGEPTLDPDLPRYLAHARALGYSDRCIETNAIQLGKPGAAERLRDAGLTAAFVSLHAPDAATSDAITRAPGTHARTVAGIHALLDAGVDVVLNAVTTAEGLGHLAALPDFVHREFGGRFKSLMISYPTLPWDQALVPAILPDPRVLRTALRAALARAFALGVPVEGLDGPCGPPLCTFDADPRLTALHPVSGPVDFRLHVAGCAGCAVRHACFGVRRAEVERFGPDIVMPLQAAPTAAPANP